MKKNIYIPIAILTTFLLQISCVKASEETHLYSILDQAYNSNNINTPNHFSIRLNQTVSQLDMNAKIAVLLPSGKTVNGRVTRKLASNHDDDSKLYQQAKAVASTSGEVTVISFDNGLGSLQLTKNTELNKVVSMRLFDTNNLSYYQAEINANSQGVFYKLDSNLIQCVELPDDTQLIKQQTSTINRASPNERYLSAAVQAQEELTRSQLNDNNIKKLQSRPSAKKTIYINSYGGVLTNTAWNDNYNSGQPIEYEAFDRDGDSSYFNADELYQIWYAWHEMAEDYAPFDVNITTDPDVYNAAPVAFRSQIIATTAATRDSFYGSNAGGVAYVGVYNYQSDYLKTGWTFNSSISSLGLTHSHESGHQMGLLHDGTASLSYYQGHGVWGPIMGAPFGKSYGQWSKGEYAGANNQQDDLQILAYVLGGVADNEGNSFETATPLSFNGGFNKSLLTPSGVFDDVDYYSFTLNTQKQIQLNAMSELSYKLGNSGAANLVFALTLYNESKQVIYSSPAQPADVSPYINNINYIQFLDPGKYYIKIEAEYSNTSPTTGFTDYANGGEYRLKVGELEGPIYIVQEVKGLSGEYLSEYRTSFFAPADTLFVSVEISSQSNAEDADLYVRFNNKPVLSYDEQAWDCRPYIYGSNESCTLEGKGGTYHILIHGAGGPYSDVNLKYTVTSDANADADNDGLSNALEMYLYNTNPLKADSDGDGIIDSVEIANGSDPSNPNQDSDNDGFSDAEEARLGSNPYDSNDVPLNITPWLKVLYKKI